MPASPPKGAEERKAALPLALVDNLATRCLQQVPTAVHRHPCPRFSHGATTLLELGAHPLHAGLPASCGPPASFSSQPPCGLHMRCLQGAKPSSSAEPASDEIAGDRERGRRQCSWPRRARRAPPTSFPSGALKGHAWSHSASWSGSHPETSKGSQNPGVVIARRLRCERPRHQQRGPGSDQAGGGSQGTPRKLVPTKGTAPNTVICPR